MILVSQQAVMLEILLPSEHPGETPYKQWVWVLNTVSFYFQLSVAHTEDWARFARTLMEIRANRADGEEEGPMELAS